MTVQCLTVSGHDSRQCGPHAHYPSAVHLSHALCARTHVINVINARRQPLTSAGHQPGASGARRAVCRARVCRQAREHTSRWTQVTNEGAAESPGTYQRTALHSGGITSVRCSLFSLERAQLSLSLSTQQQTRASTIFVTDCQLLMSVESLCNPKSK